ncbi:EamA-like transporter family [Nesidiocoris tenuis]|uniref:EamA-like transporter family n=1 Tax=Nesidiocoris tenuis TaxID=355587 RepID=A0ABN7B608_9HEMI|nr:EamA-like transporter family [Nesidiocoris tenuis]
MENGGLLLAAFSSFFFSVTSLLAKKVGLPPLVLSWFGFLGLTVLSAPLFAIHRKWSPPPKAARLVLLRSVVGTLFVILSFCAVERIPIGDASVLFYTAPVFTVGLAYVFLGEPCPPHGLPLIVALMAGVVLVTRPPALFGGGGGPSGDYVLGSAMALGASLAEAVSNVALRQLKSVHYSAVMFAHGVTSLILTSALLVTMTTGSSANTWTLDASPVEFVVLPLVLAACSALEQLTMTLALSVEQAGPVSLVQASDMIFGYLYQVLFFGEPLSPISVVGAVIIGAVVLQMSKNKNNRPSNTKFYDC